METQRVSENIFRNASSRGPTAEERHASCLVRREMYKRVDTIVRCNTL